MPTRLLAQLYSIRPRTQFLRLSAALFAVEVGVMIWLPWVVPHDAPVWLTALIDSVILLALVGPLLWLWVVRPLQKAVELRAELFSRLMQLQENERQRLARDLHDELGQSLTTLTVGLRTLEESPSLEVMQQRARELRQIGGAAHEELRRLIRGLRPTVLDDIGLGEALERLLREARESGDLSVAYLPRCDKPERLPSNLETILYRIAQEAVANCVRHSGAKHVEIALACDERAVELKITDDGCGFDLQEVLKRTEDRCPFGLLSIQRRAEEVDGLADIRSAVGCGTTVSVRVPLGKASHV